MHTPGKWAQQGREIVSDRDYPDWKYIATVRIGNGSNWCDPEGEANARLIAAAPDLLAALKRCADRLGDMDCGPELDEARAAIEKAGQPEWSKQ